MKKFKIFISFLLVSSVCLLSGCSVPSYDGFEFPPSKPSELKPATDGTFVIQRDYTDILPSVEKTIKTAVSSDGLCRIEKKASYYDVILDYEKGSPAQIGNAYAEVIQDICPDYGKIIDEYIFEMTGNLTNEDISDTLAYGAMILKNSLDKKYQEGLFTYECYKGNNKADAMAFLKDKIVSECLYYIIVETPEGNFGRDKGGIYEE